MFNKIAPNYLNRKNLKLKNLRVLKTTCAYKTFAKYFNLYLNPTLIKLIKQFINS